MVHCARGYDSDMTFPTTQRQLVFILIGCFVLGLSIAGCGSGGGGGEQSSPPLSPTMVAIQGAAHAGTPALPLVTANCRFETLQDGQQLDTAFANNLGTITLQVPPGVQGLIRCNPFALPHLILSAFVSTIGEVAGNVLRNENVTPATTVIADLIEATAPADPQARKVELLNDLAMGEPNITALVEAATLLYQEMLKAEIDSSANFSGEGESDDGGGGADGGGAAGEAGDGGEFSPLPGAVCEFSLDLDGKVRADTVLADLYADGRVDRLDLQGIAKRVNGAHDATRRRGIAKAFTTLFPNGIGQPNRVIADGANSSTPGAYFLPYPAGVPGVIQCRPADQENLVLITCVPARMANVTFDRQDVTPVSTVVCGIVTEVQQAQVDTDRNATQDDLLAQLEPLRIFLSEDRNGNGIQDDDEADKNDDGVFTTIVEIESDALLTDDNRDLALLASMSTTIFDTMRIEADALPVDATFEEARGDFFTDGRFNEPLVALEPGVVNTLDDTANQAVLGTADVVSAATTGSLRGTVMDESGQAVAGVQVVIFQAEVEVDVEGNPAITGADGAFRIDRIPVGETTVVAFLGEFEVLRVTTNVVAIVTIDLEIMPTPEIQLSPSSLVFGDVEVGSERLLPVTLTNTGVAELTVHDLQVDNVSGEPFALGNRLTLPVVIAPGSSVVVDVMYQPQTVGATLSTLRVSSDASNIPEASVALIGNAVPQPVPQVEVDPLSLSLGEVERGAERTRSLRIRNTGTAELSITSLEITAAAGGAFALSNPPSLPVNVTPGAEVTVRIRYQPLIVGSVTGALRVFSNAEAMPSVTVPLSGTGVPQPVPEIEVSRSSIAFGAVQVQAPGNSAVTVTQSVQIRNMGNVNLMLTALGIESSVGTEFTLKSAPTLPAVLTPLAAVNVEVQYRPETIGTVTGALHIRSNADNISDVTVALNGTGVSSPLPQIIANTPALAFGEMQVGSSRMLEVSLTNTGTAALTLLTATVSGNAAFTLQQAPTFPVMVSPNASVALRIQYQPSAEGSVTGVLKIESDADNTPNLIVALSGTGAPVPMPLIDVNPLDIAFAEVAVGTSRIVPVTIMNAGTADLRVLDLVLTTSTGTDFSLASAPPVPATVRPNAAFTINVQYEPMAVGTATGTLRIENNSLAAPAVIVPLSGTGVAVPVPQLVVSPLSVSFGEVELGMSPAIAVTIANAGNADLTVTGLQIDSEEPGVFRLGAVPMPPILVTPGASTPVQVIFEPTVAGPAMGTLQILSDVDVTPEVTVSLSGTGVAVPVPLISVTPPAVTFGDVQIGMTRPLEVIISNTGTDVLTIDSMTVDGPANEVFRLGTAPALPMSIQPGLEVSVQIVCAPELEGPVMGTLQIESNASNTPSVTVELSGNGVPEPMPQIAVSPPRVDFGEVQMGTTRPLSVTVTNPGTADLTLTGLAVDGGPDGVFLLGTAPPLPVVVAPGDSVPIEVVFAPVTETSVAGTLQIDHNVPNVPSFTVALNGTGVASPGPGIGVDPTALDFTEVEIGQSLTLSVSVSNPGTADLMLTALTVNSSAPEVFGLAQTPALPVVIAPSESFELNVIYQPVTPGADTGTLQIDHNVEAALAVTVLLSGTGSVPAESQIVVEPTALAFGEVQLGEGQQLTVTIRNSGIDDLSLNNVVLEAAVASGLTLSQAPIIPATVVPNGAVTAAVQYLPTTEGDVAGTLRIQSDAANAAEVTVLVSGTGVAAPAPQIVAEPTALAFGDVEVNDTQVLSVTLRNPGASDLEISGLVLEAAADSGLVLSAAPTTPVVVVPGGVVTVNVAYTPPAEGPAVGTLRVQSNAVNGSELLIPLSGTGVPLPMPQLVVTPVVLDFDAVEVGQSSALTLSISNPGTSDLEISAFTLDALAAAGFALTGVPPVPATVAVGDTLEIEVTFTPAAAGTVTGTVQLLSNAVNTPEVVVPLQGTGVSVPVPQISVQPVALSFGEVPVGSSVALPLTAQNIGSAPLNIAALTLEAEAASGFALTNAPVGAVAVLPSELFSMEMSYTPTAAGTVTGTVRIQSDAVNGAEVVVPLQGTGTVVSEPQIAVTPASVAFGAVELGQTRTMTMQVSNIGTVVLDLTEVVLEAAPGLGFTLSGSPAFPASLEPGASFSIDVIYAPIVAGPANSQVRIVSNAINAAEVVVPISGTGTLVQGPGILMLPAALAFGEVELGQNLTLNVAVRNSGTDVLDLTEVVLEAAPDSGFTLSGAPALPTSLNPGASFSMNVVYAPIATGPATSQLRIVSNAANAAAITVPISGTGTPIPGPGILVLPAALDFGAVALGQNLTLSVEVRSAGTEVLDLTGVVLEAPPGLGLTLSGVPALPTSLQPGALFSVDVSYAPTAVGPVDSQLQIASNAVNGAQVLVPVSGIGRMPEAQIEVLPAALDFGEVELGQDLTLSVEIRNVGDADLELNSVTIAAGIDTEFILGDIPERVAPGDIAVIAVTYQPTALGPVVGGSLQLQSNAVNAPNVSISLSGTGIPESETN